MRSKVSSDGGDSPTTPPFISSGSSVRWEDGRLLADVRPSRTVVSAVLLALAIWTGLPGITSLVVADGSRPSSSPDVIVAPQSVEGPKMCSTKGTTSTGKTDP